MDEKTKRLVTGMSLNSPTSRHLLDGIENKMEIKKLPDQYVNFMMESNGADGTVGPSSYLSIWQAEQIVQLNEAYAVNEFTPGFVYFASDGGGMAYAFDKRSDDMWIVEFPFESIHIDDAKLCGKTFVEFLQYLYKQG